MTAHQAKAEVRMYLTGQPSLAKGDLQDVWKEPELHRTCAV